MLIGMPIHYHRSIAVSKNIEKSKPSKLVVSYVSIFYWTSYLQVDRQIDRKRDIDIDIDTYIYNQSLVTFVIYLYIYIFYI